TLTIVGECRFQRAIGGEHAGPNVVVDRGPSLPWHVFLSSASPPSRRAPATSNGRPMFFPPRQPRTPLWLSGEARGSPPAAEQGLRRINSMCGEPAPLVGPGDLVVAAKISVASFGAEKPDDDLVDLAQLEFTFNESIGHAGRSERECQRREGRRIAPAAFV